MRKSIHNSIGIRLSHAEAFSAACHGVMRRLSAIKKNRQHAYGNPTIDLWGMDIEAAAAEMLVAKWLGKYWHSVADSPEELEGDVGKVQVRHTKRSDGSLILHDRDSSDAVFVLVTGCYPEMQIQGWILGAEGKQRRYWRETDRPAYFVPQDALLAPLELEIITRMKEEA